MSTQLNDPNGLFVSNGEVFIADMENHRVRKLLRNGQIVTICGTGIAGYNGDNQLATNAQLSAPYSVVVSSSNQVYISEMTGRIRKIDPCGMISTIAGTGEEALYNGDDQLAIHAQLDCPCGLFVTEDDEVFFADWGNHSVRKIDRFGIISTIAGTGFCGKNDGDGQLATCASIDQPTSVFQYKNEIYIADRHRIRKIDRHGIISTIGGPKVEGPPRCDEDEIIAANVKLNNPDSMFIHNDMVYFSDWELNCIRKVLPNGAIKTIAGIEGKAGYNGDDILATESEMCYPRGIFIDENSQVYIVDSTNHCIRRIDQNGMMKTIVGTPCKRGYSGDVPFDFHKYPHIGPKKKQSIKPFPHAYHDLIVKCADE